MVQMIFCLVSFQRSPYMISVRFDCQGKLATEDLSELSNHM